MRITKKIISLLLVVSMLASFFAMTGFEASAALTGQQKTDFGIHFNDTTRKLKVLQLPDIQTSVSDSGKKITQRTKDTIRLLMERYQPDVILLTGDQTQGGSSALLSKWEDTLDRVFDTFEPYMKSGCKVIAMPGNHEYDFGNLKDQWKYYNEHSFVVDWDNNFSSIDLNGEPGAGNVAISASSTNKAVALNLAIFNSKGDEDKGYLRPGGDDDNAYNEIVQWYTNMNNSIAAYGYKTQKKGSTELVPTFAAQHVILQEIYTTGAVIAGTAENGVATPSRYTHIVSSPYVRLDPNNQFSGAMNEGPCPTWLYKGATRALYDALHNPGNCLGMTFGHDHDNYFDVVDDNGFHFYMGGALTQENYNDDENPKARYFEFTLDDTTGDVSVTSEVRSYTQLTTSMTDMDEDRIEILNGDGVQFPHTLSTPKVVYVGASGNNTDPRIMQEFGNNVQSSLLDYKKKAPYEQDLDVKYCLPDGATNIEFKAIRSSNGQAATITDVGTEATSENSTIYKKKITPDSVLEAGERIDFSVKYKYDNTDYEIHNVSYVESIKQPAGFNSWFRGWRENNESKHYVDLAYVATLSGAGAYSKARATGGGTGSFEHYQFNTYYDYSKMQTDPDKAYTNKSGDNRFSMFRWSPSRVEVTEGLLAQRPIVDGAAAQTDIYLDASALQPVSTSDPRLDTGISIDFWVPKDLDRGFSEFVAGIGFYEGDHGFNPAGATIDPNDGYSSYNDALWNENDTTAGGHGIEGGTLDIPTEFTYNAYAGQQKYLGLGTTHENNNKSEVNLIGSKQGDYNGFPLVVDSKDAALALDGEDMTMYTGVRNKGSSDGGYRILLYDIAPYYLVFHTYDKSALRELTMGELMNPRKRSDYPNASDDLWSKYIMAYEGALASYAQAKTNQDAVDSSYDTLRLAIAALLDSTKVADTNLELKGDYGFGSVVVPPILYVNGSTIQTTSHSSYYTDESRKISFTVPDKNVTNVKAVAINNNSNETENTAVTISGSLSGTTYTGYVTGGTASAGGAVYYKLSYEKLEDKNKDGKNDEYQLYAASYVRGTTFIKGQWMMRNTTYKNGSWHSSKAHRHYHYLSAMYDATMDVGQVLGVRGASAVVAAYPFQGKDSFSTAVNYPTAAIIPTADDYTAGTKGHVGWAVGTIDGVDFDGDHTSWRASDKVLIYNDRDRAKEQEYWIGMGTSSREYVVAHFFYNKQAVDSATKLQAKITFTHGGDYGYREDADSSTNDTAGRQLWSLGTVGTLYQGWPGDAVGNTGAANIKAHSGDILEYVSGSTIDNTLSSGSGDLSGTIQNAFDLTSLDVEAVNSNILNKRGKTEAAGYIQRYKNHQGIWISTSTGYGFIYNAVDRSVANEYIGKITNKDITGYNKADMDPEWWDDWRQECFDAYVAWGNLWGEDFDSTRISELCKGEKFKLADYKELVAAVNNATNAGLVVNTGTNDEPSANANESIADYTDLLFKVHANDDSRYAGQTYDKTMFVNNAADLIKVIQDRLVVAYSGNANDAAGTAEENHLDFRYQGIINDYAEQINAAYDRLRLAGADYTEFDKYADLYDKDADTITFMRDMQAAYNSEASARNYANEKVLPSGVYTSASRNVFVNAVDLPEEYRTLKKPSETMIVGNLPRIYPDENGYTFKYPVATANNTDCLYNKARDAYEDLEFRRAGEYYQANGQWTDSEGVTYYANYNKIDRSGSYLYTPVFKTSYNELSADITNGGFVVTDNKVKPIYNAGNNGDKDGNGTNLVYEKDANGEYKKDANGDYIVARDADGNVIYAEDEIWVLNGAGEPINAIAPWTDASWGVGATYGFSDAYEKNLLAGSTYQDTKGNTEQNPWILALYVERDILPDIADVDYYYDKLKDASYDMSQLDIQKNTPATYEKGTNAYADLSSYVIFDDNGNVLTDGAQWYTAETWSDYITAKSAQPGIIDGAALAENQGAINALTQAIFQKRAALQLRTMEDYKVSDGNGGYMTFESINADAQAKYDIVNNKKVKVFALRADDPVSYAGVAGNDPLFIDHPYYTNDYIIALKNIIGEPEYETDESGNVIKDANGDPVYKYKKDADGNDIKDANGDPVISYPVNTINYFKSEPMATSIAAYINAVNAFKTKHDQSGDPVNMNKANTSTLQLLLNKTWIPEYDKYGSENYNNGKWLIGEEFDGSDWYSNWDQYDQARKNALAFFNSTEFDGQKVAVNLTHYGNQVPAGDFYVGVQGAEFTIDKDASSPTYRQPISVDGTSLEGTVNKAAYDLVVAYYTLKHKTIKEFNGTVAGITGSYDDINNALDAKLLQKENQKVDVVVVDEATGTLKTIQKSIYDEATIEAARHLKQIILDFESNTEAPNYNYLATNYNAYIAAVEQYNNTIDSLVESKVFLDGWNGILDHLNENAGDTASIADSGTLIAYFNAVYTGFDPSHVYAEGGTNINTIFTNKAMYDGFNLKASQGQTQYNDLVTALYNELNAAVFVPAQVTRAAGIARTKIAQGTKAAYDPYPLNGRTPVTTVTKYDPDSVAAVEAKIKEIEDQSKNLWNTDPAVTGYKSATTVIDGTMADEIWAAAGLETESKAKNYDTTDRDERYLLIEGGQFLAALNDALAYAKGELYEADGVTVKQFDVVKGDGTVIAAPIFTDESVAELLQAIADGESVDSTTSQDLIDDYVFAILEHTDINNTINLLTAEKGYYGQLMDKAEDEGLKYKPADYTYFLEELGLTFAAESDAAQALVDQVWVDEDGNGEFELVNSLGSTYFTAETWDAYYKAYNNALAVVRNLTAKDQEAYINNHTTAVYETRTALEWNTIGKTSEWTQINKLGESIEALRGEVATIYTFTNSTLVPAEESSDGMAYFTAPTWGTKDVNKYGEAETAEIIAAWETFQSEFDENDPYTKHDQLVAIYNDLYNMYNELVLYGQKQLSTDGEFAQGYIDLVNNFIAGSFDGETRQYTSDYLKVEDGTQIMTGVSSLTGEMRDENAVRNAQEKFIEDKLCQIYDLLKGGNINSLEAINAYTMELYEYIIGTPAQYAGFALDLRQDMIDYLSTTITASVRLRDTAATPLPLYTETVHVFDQSFKESKIEEITVGYFDEIANWPTINLLNANVGLLDALSNEEADYNTFVYMVYDEETGEVTGEVMLNSLMENIGAYSPAYNEAIGSVSPHAVRHLNWITTKAVIDGEETGNKTYVLGGPVNADSKAYNVSEEGPTFAYAMDVNNNLDGNWYTKGYGENIYGDIDGDGVDEMYYIAAGDTVTGSDAGGWFTDTSYEKLRTALNNAKVEAADGTTAPIYYEMFGSGDAAQAKYQEIENYQAENGLTGLCWDSATRAEYITALQTDQKKIDNATASIYEALMGLKLLNAVDAYREVAALIYAALGQVPEYSDANTTDVIITDELVGTLSSFEYGGRLFNISLVDELGEAGVDYVITDEDGNIVSSEDFDDEKTYFYYSTKLPTSYSGGKAAVDAILTMLQSEMSPMLTIDKAKEVNGDEETSVKYKIEYELKNLQLSKADTNKIKSLTAAFLYNNPANSNALGSYKYNDNGVGEQFFKSTHAALASDGTNAGDYRNSEEMMKSSLYNESGFYDFTMYEHTSLMAVINYLNDNNIITDETYATVRNFHQDNAIGFNLVFDYTKHGGDVFNWASTRQDDVNEIYAGLVDVINALELKDANTGNLDIQAAAADEVVLQENIYDHSAVNPVSGRTFWEEFEAAKAEAEKYENANIVNQEQVDAAAENLELAIRKLVLNEDNYAPVVSVHTTKDELDAFYNSHDELKKALGENSLTPVTYVEKNVGNYALYVYTNQLNPQIVISAQDIKQFTENNAVRTVSTSKPEKINVVSGATLSTISADVIVPHLKDDGTIDGIQELTPNTSAGVDTQTAKNSDGTYVEDSYAYVVLNPKFDATKPATQQAVQYVIDAKDSAQTKDAGGNLLPDNNSADSVAYINGLAEDAVLADGKIKIFVYYMNAMPEDGNDSGVVTGDDNNTAINAAAVLTDHEYKSLASGKWINHAMLYRTFPKALKSWEYSENAEQIAEKDALYTDPTFGDNNLGSFVYVLDKNADENSLDYKVAQEYYSTNNAETAKALFINYLTNGIINPATNNAYIAEFESKIESYSGFMTYGAYTDDGQYENWQKPMGSIDNGTLVFVHVADRFGNVCNRLIEWNYYDYKVPTFGTVADGQVSVTEDGGSGIANIDLFTYAGTTGGSLYTEYHLSKGLKLQEIAGQITYVSENNEYVVENLKAGALYTVAVKDGAGNVGSAHVKADADGKITISANVDYTNAVQYGKSAAEFATQSGEDLGVIDFVFNSNEIIMLNYEIPSSIVKAGPDGNVFANDATEPLNIIVKSEVEAIKLYNADTGEEEIWTSENAKIKDLGDGTSKWTVKYSFAEGDHNYTATAMVNGEWESASVDFSFTATTKSVKISFLNTGLGRTEYSYNDGIVKKLSSTDVLIAPYGAVVNVKATSTRTGSEFLYWKNDSTDRIISTADTMEFVAVTNVSLTSQFTTTGVYTENKKLVVYVNNAENVVDSFEIAQGGNYTVPDAPALADHVFEEWSMTKDEVLASEDKFIVVKPVYSLVVTNTVTLTEGNWTVTGAGEYQTVGNARAVATISASDVNEDGAGFLYWLDAETGEVASYNRSYTFNVIKDTELTPVYGDASAVVPVPVARITTIKLDSKANSVSFYAERSIPAGYDIIKTGIIVTKSAEKGEDESAFIIDASGVANGSSTKLTANGLYSFSVKADDGTTVYARAYSICMNADGDIITTYSPISSCTV